MKRLRFGKLAALAATGVLFLSACGGGPGGDNSSSAGKGDTVKIGIAMKTEVQARWRHEVAVMEKVAKEKGAEIIVQWANDDITKQGNQIENLMSQGIDALIVVPVTDKAGPYLQKVKEEGIPVIAYDLLPEDVEIDMFVTRDNKGVGELQINAALEFIGDTDAKIALLKGDPANMVAQGIASGYEAALSNAPKVDVVADQWIQAWSTEEALGISENTLSAHNDNISAFVTGTDGLAMGSIQALKARGLQGKVFVSGLDVEPVNARFIAEGVQTMSVWTDIEDQADKAITAAIELANGQAPTSEGEESNGGKPVPARYASVVPIFKDDLCRFIHEISPQDWITEDEVFGSTEIPANCNSN